MSFCSLAPGNDSLKLLHENTVFAIVLHSFSFFVSKPISY